MSLVPAKCTQCGANIEINDTMDAGICPFCNTAFVTEKAIKNYITNVNNTYNVMADNVNFSLTKDFEIRGGTLIKYNGENVNVVIPKNVYVIGKEAFAGLVALRSVEIHEGVREICESAFDSCESIESISLPDNLEIIDKNAFRNCFNLETVRFGKGIKFIGDYAFSNCVNLNNFRFPGLEILGQHAFDGCKSITKVILPKSLQQMSYNVFFKCENLKRVVYNCIDCKCKYYYQGKYYPPFYGLAIEEIVIGENVKSIPSALFYNNDTFEFCEIVVPSSCESIGKWSFVGCCGMIYIPKKVMQLEPEWDRLDHKESNSFFRSYNRIDIKKY